MSSRPAKSVAPRPHVDVVVVVGERERRPAQPEQGDDLLRLHLGRQQQDVAHCVLGHPAELLVPEDRDVAEDREVGREAVDVRRDDSRAGAYSRCPLIRHDTVTWPCASAR